MGTFGNSIKHLEKSAHPKLGGKWAESLNKFHTFSVVRAHPSMQSVSFDASIKLRQPLDCRQEMLFSLFTIFQYNILTF